MKEETLSDKELSLKECLSRQIEEFGPDIIEYFGGKCLIQGCNLEVNENGVPKGITNCMEQPPGIH